MGVGVDQLAGLLLAHLLGDEVVLEEVDAAPGWALTTTSANARLSSVTGSAVRARQDSDTGLKAKKIGSPHESQGRRSRGRVFPT